MREKTLLTSLQIEILHLNEAQRWALSNEGAVIELAELGFVTYEKEINGAYSALVVTPTSAGLAHVGRTRFDPVENILTAADIEILKNLRAAYNSDWDHRTDEDLRLRNIGWRSPIDVTNLDTIPNIHNLVDYGLVEASLERMQYRATPKGRALASKEFGKQLADKHIGMVNEVITEFMASRADIPTREQILEAQIADLKKQLRDVENERDIRGMLLDQMVDMRERLIDSKSNSWIDSIATIETEIMNGQTNELAKQAQITVKDAKIKHLEEIANRIVHAVNEGHEADIVGWGLVAELKEALVPSQL